MNLERTVLALSASGEQLLGERELTREEFDNALSEGYSVVLKEARRFDSARMQRQAPSGEVMVQISFNLLPIEPFAGPISCNVIPVRWVHLIDTLGDGSVKAMLTGLIGEAERRETEMRATSAGIQLASDLPGGPRG